MKVVQACLDRTAGRQYVEIGVAHGASFFRIRADTKIAVDPDLRMAWWIRRISERRAKHSQYFTTTSDDFFAHHASILPSNGIDVVFIDGLHTWQQALRDVENALLHLSDAGFVVLHDCNPVTPALAHPAPSFQEFRKTYPWHGAWCGDVWKAIALLRSTRSDLVVAVLDCDYGVGIVRRGRPESTLNLTPGGIEAMTYDDLRQDRKAILNLKRPADLARYLEPPA
jgi:hypothetical protein